MRRRRRGLVSFLTSISLTFLLFWAFGREMIKTGENALMQGGLGSSSITVYNIEERLEEKYGEDLVTIKLKNKGEIRGVILEKNAGGLLVDVGFGTLGLSNSDIESIGEPTAKEKEVTLKRHFTGVRDQEEVKRIEIREEKAFFERIEEAARIKKEEAKLREGTTEIKFKDRSRITVKALLNDKVEASMLIDTGATVVFISPRTAQELGIESAGKDTVQIVLGDGSTAKAIPIILDSVKVGNAEAKNVQAAIVLEKPGQSIGDGGLGMSYLHNFHLQLDTKRNLLILKRK